MRVAHGSPEKPGTHADSPRGRSAELAFEHVSSSANATVKLLKSLDRKKARSETGLFLAEGARLAEEALNHGWAPAHVLAGASALERPQTAALLARMKKAGARVLTASEKVLAAVSRKDNPQTVVAAFKQRLSKLVGAPDGRRPALGGALRSARSGESRNDHAHRGCGRVSMASSWSDSAAIRFRSRRCARRWARCSPCRSRTAKFADFNAWRKQGRRADDRGLDARQARPRQGRLRRDAASC